MISTAVAMSLAAVSCQKDDTLQYNNVTMGNIVDGIVVSDQGNVFNIVENEAAGNIDTLKRVIMTCDILRKTAGTDDSYDIRLTEISPVLAKDPVRASETVDEDILKKDPVQIQNIWQSGGYLNMKITVPVEAGSGRKHLINLVLDDSTAADGTYTFELRHNGFGEVWTTESVGYVLAGTYVSFPIGKLIAGDSAKVCIKWTSHKTVGNGWTLETTDNDLEFNWTRDRFEQAPASATSETATAMI